MKHLLLIIVIFIAGCSKPSICIDGKLWVIADSFEVGSNIYKPTDTQCMEIK